MTTLSTSIELLKNELGEGFKNMEDNSPGCLKLKNGVMIVWLNENISKFSFNVNTGDYSMKRDISEYGFKNALGAFASAQYAQGHPTAVVHSISTSTINIGINASAGGIYVTWIVIGTWK